MPPFELLALLLPPPPTPIPPLATLLPLTVFKPRIWRLKSLNDECRSSGDDGMTKLSVLVANKLLYMAVSLLSWPVVSSSSMWTSREATLWRSSAMRCASSASCSLWVMLSSLSRASLSSSWRRHSTSCDLWSSSFSKICEICWFNLRISSSWRFIWLYATCFFLLFLFYNTYVLFFES